MGGWDCGKEGGARPQLKRFPFRKLFLWSWVSKLDFPEAAAAQLPCGVALSLWHGARAAALTGTGRTKSGFPARSAMCR